jgi:uncharacterized protein YjbI with pentapeptide repeats
MKLACLSSLLVSAAAFQMPNQRNMAISSKTAQESLSVVTAASIFAMSILSSEPAAAVSGGGLDYAGIDISGQDFSNSKAYKGKDFTQTLAKATNFSNSNLQGCRFYKAFLVNTNFEGADIRGAALEDTSMDGANLKNTIASGTYFGASLLDVATAEGADFTDASIPPKTLTSFCNREDVKGTNPVTGNDTRDTLMCL